MKSSPRYGWNIAHRALGHNHSVIWSEQDVQPRILRQVYAVFIVCSLSRLCTSQRGRLETIFSWLCPGFVLHHRNFFKNALKFLHKFSLPNTATANLKMSPKAELSYTYNTNVQRKTEQKLFTSTDLCHIHLLNDYWIHGDKAFID